MLKKRILSLVSAFAMVATVMSSFVVANAEAKATVKIDSFEKIGVLSSIAGNLATEDVQIYGPAGKMVYPLYEMQLSISGLYATTYNDTWTACEGFIANAIKTRVKFDSSIVELVNYFPDSPLGGTLVGGAIGSDAASVSWATVNKSAVSGVFAKLYFIPKSNADITAEATFTLDDDNTQLLVDYYDGSSMSPTISDDFATPKSGMVVTEGLTINKTEKTLSTDWKEADVKEDNASGKHTYGVEGTISGGATFSNIVFTIKDVTNDITKDYTWNVGTAIEAKDVTFGLNIWGVPANVELDILDAKAE